MDSERLPRSAARDHAWVDQRNRVLSTAVAEHLRHRPALVASALARVRARLAAGPGPARWALEQWASLLSAALAGEAGRAALFAVLTEEGEHAARLRQSTPFAGVVPEAERAAILRHLAGVGGTEDAPRGGG